MAMKLFQAVKSRIRTLLRKRQKVVSVRIPVLCSDLLKGRCALITGGAGGIGFAISEAFGKAGASVIIAGRTEAKLRDAVRALQELNIEASYLVLDVCDIHAMRERLSKVGIFDILVNNAGYVGGGNFGNTTCEEYDKVLETNLKGSYFLSQEVSRRWIDNGIAGNILNICSASSLRPGESPYILSKWGMRALTVGMARRLIKHDIVVNGLAPGCTDTEKFSRDGDLSSPGNPAQRMVTRTEVANLAVIMVSCLARMVVGDVLYVTGGAAITTFDD